MPVPLFASAGQIKANQAPGGGFLNPFQAGGPGNMTFRPDPGGGHGSWIPNPRQQLAQVMMQGMRGGSDRGSMSGGSGYSTSGPQSGGFGYGGGMGGWGRAPGGTRSSATKGGMWGGGLY